MSSIMKGIVDEEIGGNYLYHSVQDADTAKAILNSGYFLANRSGSQPATDAQTPYPVVSFGRNINYQTSGANVDRDYQVVFVVDRRKLEANYKTLGTSQNQLSTDKWKTMGPRWTKSYDKNGDGKLTVDELPAGIGGETLRKNYFQPKAGGEFEEAVPVKSGKLPLKGILLGFYLVPGKAASKDPELLSNPLRLDMPKPNIFVKAKQEEPVNESEEVAVIYIDGKPSAKYAKKHEAERDAEFMRSRHPNKKIEIKHEVRETEAKKGADGKRCWKGKRYAGTENGKDKCIPVKNEAANPAQQAAIAINMKKKGKKPANEGVIVGHDANDPEVAILGGAGTMSLSRLKKKAHQEALQLADDIANGKYNASSYNMKQLHNTLNTIVAAEKEMEKLYFGEDTDMRYAAEKTPAINPYGGQKDVQHRGAISETPTDNPTGVSGDGGWRKYKPKSAGEIGEAKKSEFRLKAEQQQLKQLEKINNSTLPHWAKEYLTLLTDPNGKVFKAAYYSFGKGQDARKEAAEYIMQKYKIPQEWIDKINLLKGSHVTKNREEDRHFNWDMPSMHEDTSYAGGMGQGGSAGESYRKFKPKSAGTYKESSIMKGLRK